MTRKSGLGRGLDALLPGAAGDRLEDRSPLKVVSTDSIEPNPRQPRRTFEPEALAELTASITALGVLQPLLVRARAGGRYELIAGERRWRAAQQAGLETVPVLIVETDEQGSLERALVENIHRENLNPIEEAMAYRQLLDEGGSTQEELGDKLGRHRVTISNMLRLLELPVEIQQYMTEGKLSGRHGRALLALQGNPMQLKLARRAALEGLSVRDIEHKIREYERFLAPRRSGRPHDTERPAAATEAQQQLAHHLQARVRVDVGKKKGKIVIDFVSLEELQRLLDIIIDRASDAEPSVAAPAPRYATDV